MIENGGVMLRSRRVKVVVAAAAMGVVLLSGCGTQKAGSAAIAGDQRLSQREVTDQIDEVNALYTANPDTQRLTDDQLTQAAITWWLNGEVLAAFAAEQDLQVTQTQIDQALGPEDQRDQIAMGAGIAPSHLESAAEALVTYQVAFQSLVSQGQSQQQAAALLDEELRKTADELGVKVNPRFGSGWVPGVGQQLAPRNPDRLSSPAEGTETASPQPSIEP